MTSNFPGSLAPDARASQLIVPAPAPGPGNWAGAPSCVYDDGTYWLAYRLRRAGQRGYGVVVARSDDGLVFETVTEIDKESFGSSSLERPALVRAPDGSWRLYVSVATPASFHWRVDLLSASDPTGFDPAGRITVLPGEETLAVKDPYVTVADGTWRLWLCCHPLDDESATDRMWTTYATSRDGIEWEFFGDALTGPAGDWDQRGTRVSCVRRTDSGWACFYDGRATAAQNAQEMTGVASGPEPFSMRPAAGGPAYRAGYGSGCLRYVTVVDDEEGCPIRVLYEAVTEDGSHALFSQAVPGA